MTSDSIPQQAGPGAGADLRRVEHVLWTLLEHNTLHFGDKHSTVTQAREALNEVRSILSHLAAPLAVEDSRERCASSDARMLTNDEISNSFDVRWEDFEPYPKWMDRMHAVIRKFCEVNGIRLAAMAAASSGKERME